MAMNTLIKKGNKRAPGLQDIKIYHKAIITLKVLGTLGNLKNRN